ncbi:hypothetical protein AGR8A_Lc40308 [Agrobacterium fabrum str. J-07]|nr:hypothetical protein AGR8A_Lc40308 [Agrobacterium fabrum str. J-07]
MLRFCFRLSVKTALLLFILEIIFQTVLVDLTY